MKKKLKIGVLASTRGTDLQAIIDAINSGKLNAEIACVISNKAEAFVLERARNHNIEAIFIDVKGKNRDEYDKEVSKELDKRGIELICLIGYMRIVSDWFVKKYCSRIINVHPSLLPAFAGGMDKDVHTEVLKAGLKETGCTIHFVTEQVDGGPIIIQKKVPVLANDTPDSLKERVQAAEKVAYVEAIKLFSENKLKVSGSKVLIK
ncbi:TPA: phosphoribosylglycinamide formyltransferase [archaeon]|uniref:phosphoribosylglycinamide formyltransferase 1 n=1 Tax=Candidatus Naiadarchaeum limnaeum TaxID=2756139 RepID=A0A832UWF3_9ARCH|nr:phosphoribosylglycinamide formyltransferase [Candidatus Naiadarchaeum limnaeum]